MRVLIDGLWHEVQLWLPQCSSRLKEISEDYKLPIVDLSGKREDCEDPNETSGGDDCGDIGGG
jgi:hypothetical protein